MQVRRPSASKLDRALACPASCWLPEGPARPSLGAAERGTRIHEALERHYYGARRADALAAVRDDERALAAAAIDGAPRILPFGDWPMIEVECWYHPLAQEAMVGTPSPCHHEHPTPPPDGYYRGTADLIGEDPDTGRLAIVDHKTGNPRYQTPPGTSAQLRHFAAWLAAHPLSAGRVSVEGVELMIYLTQKAGTAGALLRYHISPVEIEHFAQRYQDLALELDGVESGLLVADPDAGQVGKHCTFCSAAATCAARLEYEAGR